MREVEVLAAVFMETQVSFLGGGGGSARWTVWNQKMVVAISSETSLALRHGVICQKTWIFKFLRLFYFRYVRGLRDVYHMCRGAVVLTSNSDWMTGNQIVNTYIIQRIKWLAGSAVL
jgi:hypothetical protein